MTVMRSKNHKNTNSNGTTVPNKNMAHDAYHFNSIGYSTTEQ